MDANGGDASIIGLIDSRFNALITSRQFVATQSGGKQFIPYRENRNTGDFNIPGFLETIFHRDSMDNCFTKSSVDDVLDKYPEPRGGFLKAQRMDENLSANAKKNDDSLRDQQRMVLCTERMLLKLHTTLSEALEPGDPRSSSVLQCLQETMQFVLSNAAGIRVLRRQMAARDHPERLLPQSKLHLECGSSDDSRVFGPELLAALEAECKRNSVPKGTSPSGPRPGNRKGYNGKRSGQHQQSSRSK